MQRVDWLEQKYIDTQDESPAVDAHLLRALVKRVDKLESLQGPVKTEGGHATANPSSADMAQLTNTIHQLSLLLAHDQPQNTGNELRPEYWVQVIAKGMNVQQMSYGEKKCCLE